MGKIDPNSSVTEIRSMQQFIAADLAQSRFTMLVLAAFASIALLLSSIGLSGVISAWVTRRTPEIGIRLGAL